MRESTDPAAATLARNLFLLGEAESLAEAFAQAGVPLIFLKGTAMLLRGLVGPGARAMTDIDILVRAGHRTAAEAAIFRRGYSRLAGGEPGEYVKESRAGMFYHSYVDLHTWLWHADESQIWQATAPVACGRTQALTLTPEAMVVHAMAHSMCSNGSLDAKTRCDLAAMLCGPDFKWDMFCDHVGALGLEAMAAAVLRDGVFLARGSADIPDRAFGRLDPTGVKRLAFFFFRLGCGTRPNAVLEYVLPLLINPGLLRRSFFPGRAELKLRYGDASPLSLLRRQSRLLGNLFRRLFRVRRAC